MRSSVSPGFTLIELMIVVAIIAIIATIAIPSLLRSRMAANEVAAVSACKVYAEAQSIYVRTDFSGSGVLQFSTALSGANSLLGSSGELALIDKTMAMAEGQPGSATAKSGYVFTILTSQGSAATGGTRNYMSSSNGAMVYGFGLSAAPDAYDATGRDSVIINNNGVIFQNDRGPVNSPTHVTIFNPDTAWTPTQ